MKRWATGSLVVAVALLLGVTGGAGAQESGGNPGAGAGTIDGGVRVTVIKSGGSYRVGAVSGGGPSGPSGSSSGCTWTVIFSPDLSEAPYGLLVSPKRNPDDRFALLACNGTIIRGIWVATSDIVDLDAVAAAEASRYVKDVLVPQVRIGVNPTIRGLVGLRSWFWIDGFTGLATAPPITAFGVTIDVRMVSGSVVWNFGDGQEWIGDLGRAYPAPSTVQHGYQRHGSYPVAAAIHLAPEYRVDGGPWLTLPGLEAVASAQHDVEQRQAIITGS